MKICVFLLACIVGSLHAQSSDALYQSIDRRVAFIPESQAQSVTTLAQSIQQNFKTDIEKTRAIFSWIATHIEYDYDNMFALNYYGKNEDRVQTVLKNRKGVCDSFAALFDKLCSLCNIRSYIIEGYTKQNGMMDHIPHAWCAAYVDGGWFMFDPTWGAGYVDKGKYYKQLDNHYFKMTPSECVKTHIPFDYLWQFLPYPITHAEFYSGVANYQNKPYFNFADTLRAHEQKNKREQLHATSRRIKQSGIKNSLIFDRLQHLQMEIENDKQRESISAYNSAIAYYNAGVNSYNDFIQYRNKQFSPLKTDAEIQNVIEEALMKLKIAKLKMRDIQPQDDTMQKALAQLTKSIDNTLAQIKEQQVWLTEYFKKPTNERPKMFLKRG